MNKLNLKPNKWVLILMLITALIGIISIAVVVTKGLFWLYYHIEIV